MGPVRHSGQHRARDGSAAGRRARRDGARRDRQGDRGRHAAARANPGRFPWGGHLGIRDARAGRARDRARLETTLVFTNTRSQAEIWYQSLLEARPQWAGLIALHHGSLDREVREWVERGLKEGRLKAVVATSSLDLGVDFLPVERVLQIGSSEGRGATASARGPQRTCARARVARDDRADPHARTCRGRGGARRRHRRPGRIAHAPEPPLDVLVQHLVTLASAPASAPSRLSPRSATPGATASSADEEFAWALDFVGRGGESLRAYPEYHRVVRDAEDGFFACRSAVSRGGTACRSAPSWPTPRCW